MLNAAKYLHAKFWLVLAWLIILLALLVSALRLLLPGIDLEPYRQEIERVAERKADLPLTIGAMQAQLKGVHLVLNFTDVSALDEESGEPLLYSPQVLVEVQLLKSLLTGQLHLGGAKVVGTRLKMERYPDGSFSLQGLGGDTKADPGAVTEILLGQNHLRLVDAEIQLKSAIPGRPPLQLSGVHVDLLNDGLRHQLSVTSRIGRGAKERVRLIADLRQPSAESLAMSGPFYLQCEDLELGGRLGEWLPEGYRVDRGQAQVEVWGELQQGALQWLTGHTEFNDLRIAGLQGVPPFALQRLATDLDWRKGEAGWILGFDRFSLARQGEEWPAGALELAWWKESDDGMGFHLQADYLSLEGVHDFMSILRFPDPDLHKATTGLSPRGHLRGLDFTLQRSQDKRVDWHLKGEVDAYASNAWESIPGLQGVRMSFDGSQSGGWLKIDSDNLVIDYPQLFRRPLKADLARGDFLWNFDLETGLHLQSDYLEMSNPDLQTLSRIELQIPITGKDLFVDMQSDFWDADGARKSDYLPVTVMPEDLVEWLDVSVVGGHVKSGSFLLYGPVSEFPFKGHEGRFEVWFGVEDLLLDYMPGWPALSEAVAEVHFINNTLKAKLQEGLMLDSRLQDVSINIDQLRNPTPVEIRGQVRGPFQDIMTVLGETPLREDFHPFVEAVSVGGDTRTELDLAIPLEDGRGELKVDGAVNFDHAALTVKEAELELQELTGNLQFNLSGVTGKGLRARLLNKDVSFDVSPYRHKERDWTRITSRMPLDLKQLKRQFPDWKIDHFQGSGEAELAFRIAHQPSRVPVRMSLKSDLKGVTVALPEPLGKAAQESRLLDLGADFLRDGSTELRVRYGKNTHALLRFFEADDKPWVAAIGFGQEPLSLDGVEGFHLSGQLARLNADEWIAWVGDQSSDERDRLPQIEMDLRVDELIALGTACPQTRFSYKNYADGYRVNLTSDTVQGSMQVPGDLRERSILGRFDYIKLNLQELASTITGERSSSKQVVDLDPRAVPAVNFSVEKLYINDHPIGKGNLTWSKEKDGITVNSLTLVGNSIDLSGQGYWRLTPKGHSTGLNLQMQTPSLGDLQHDLGLATGIEGAATKVKAELYWPTSPLEMGAEQLYGSLWLDVGKGQVNNVDPGVGRLIGLFSLNALGKRLALDFSDLFSKGMAFDTIQGNFVLNDGDAYTTDLAMRSTAAAVDIRGRTGLSSRTYDQQVVVTPNVSATLPLVGALAISPTVGVALAVTQQLFGKHFDRIAMRTYEVSGSWDNPQFSQIQLNPEDAGGDAHMPEMPGD